MPATPHRSSSRTVRAMLSAVPNPVSTSTSNGRSVALIKALYVRNDEKEGVNSARKVRTHSTILLASSTTSFRVVTARSGILEFKQRLKSDLSQLGRQTGHVRAYPKEEAATPLPDKYRLWKPKRGTNTRSAKLKRVGVSRNSCHTGRLGEEAAVGGGNSGQQKWRLCGLGMRDSLSEPAPCTLQRRIHDNRLQLKH